MSISGQVEPENRASPVTRLAPPSLEEAGKEFDAVVAALPMSARQLQLINYIREKYLNGETEKLHEYDIATEVFGRSKTTFNPGEDAIVRVEAHRLRRRLKDYYENEGKNHPIHVSIPPGTYVPVFLRPHNGPVGMESGKTPAHAGVPWWLYLAAGAAIAFAAFGVYRAFSTHGGKSAGTGDAASGGGPTTAPNGMAFAETPLRILAGYNGKPQIDSAGGVWQSDEYFRAGGTWDRPPGFVGGTSDPILFEHWRNGDFSYEIPLRPGVYELHLYFVAIDAASNGSSTFSVSVNYSNVLTGFDVYSDALGVNIADERVLRDVSPASDGFLRLGFNSERGSPALNAIEILPGTPRRQLPIRLVMRPRPFTDHDGNLWHPDDYFMNGYTATKTTQIAGTPDPEIFAAERYGHFTYAIPVDTRDRYTLILHFAEFYFGPSASGVGGVGSRVFRVLCNGNTLLDNFDIYKESGSLRALTKTFYHLKPTAQGKLNITFEPIANNATVSGIEVLDEGS